MKIVELLLARNPDANRIYFEQVLRREMGKARIAFRLGPQGVDTSGKNPRSFSPTELAQAIRKAVEYGVSGLIVEPVEEPAVLDALAEAGRRGVSLLALDRAVTLPGGPAIPVVRYESFERPGRQIIEATLDAAKLLGEPGRGRIVLLHHRSADPSRNERRESLAGPLRAAGKPFEVIEFEGDHTVAVAALQNAMATPPRIAIVLADDEQGMTACSQILVQLRQSNRPEFLFAGFIPYDYRSAGEMLNQGIAFGDPSVESFATQTFQTLRRLLEGKTVDKPVEIPITIHKKSTLFVPTKPSAED